MTESNPEAPVGDLEELYQKFREVKHSVNNSLAVIMARAELAQMNPTHQAKLIETVLSRGRQIVTELQAYADEMRAQTEKK